MTTAFRLASYNILANSYAIPQRYRHIPAAVLEWGARKQALAAHVAGFDADVICLQEVEPEAYALLAHALGGHGYTGSYAQKAGGRPDGCATFYRAGALRFVDCATLYYHDEQPGAARSGHLALLTRFAYAGGTLTIAGTHLRWERDDKPAADHVGYRQLRELLATCAAPDRAAGACVICGDLNAPPGSAVIAALSAGGFADAYHGHAQPTSNPNQHATRLDYIWHTAGLRAQPAPLPAIDDSTPLPSHGQPSDHLAVLATLTAR